MFETVNCRRRARKLTAVPPMTKACITTKKLTAKPLIIHKPSIISILVSQSAPLAKPTTPASRSHQQPALFSAQQPSPMRIRPVPAKTSLPSRDCTLRASEGYPDPLYITPTQSPRHSTPLISPTIPRFPFQDQFPAPHPPPRHQTTQHIIEHPYHKPTSIKPNQTCKTNHHTTSKPHRTYSLTKPHTPVNQA